MRRRNILIALVGLLLLGSAAIAFALPQQQGSVDLLSQADGQWQGPGEAQGSSATGASVVGLGDIFGDGRSALAIGAPEADPGGRQSAGSVYVVAGQSGSGTVDLTALSGRGYRIDGAAAGDQLGFSLSSLRLANGDPALAVGAPYASPQGRGLAGEVYVVDLDKLHADIDLSASTLDPAVVSVISGPAACAESGYALANAGAVDGSGSDDLLVGAPGADPTGCPQTGAGAVVGGNTGAAFLVYGAQLPPSLDLASGGDTVTAFDGVASGDRAGSSVSGVGGAGSFMIGAPAASPAGRSGAGAVYLLHGATPGATASLASPPSGSTTFEGAAADDALGFALSTTTGFAAADPAGTVELALGAPQASPDGRNQAGSVFLVPSSGEPATVDLSTLGTSGGAAGGRIDGADPGDEAGYAIADVGDLNGDGTPDLAVGAPFLNSQTGQGRYDNGGAYVLYGGTGPLNLDLLALHSRGYIATGARDSDEAGTSVAGVADESGDGRPDLLIGAPYAENTTGSTPTVGGAVYALLGFGTPAVSYSPAAETGQAGEPLTPLTPTVRSTGQPSFSISPALPQGLVIDANTGEISGTPSAAAPSADYTVQMTDLAGVADATVSLAVTGSSSSTGAGSGAGTGAAGSGAGAPGTGSGAAGSGAGAPGTTQSANPGGGGGAGTRAVSGCAIEAVPAASVLHAVVARGARTLRLTGGAAGAGCGRIVRVEVAVARVAGRRCSFYLGSGRFGRRRACGAAIYRRASGTTHWRYTVPGPLAAGFYEVRAFAVDSTGAVQRHHATVYVRVAA